MDTDDYSPEAYTALEQDYREYEQAMADRAVQLRHGRQYAGLLTALDSLVQEMNAAASVEPFDAEHWVKRLIELRDQYSR